MSSSSSTTRTPGHAARASDMARADTVLDGGATRAGRATGDPRRCNARGQGGRAPASPRRDMKLAPWNLNSIRARHDRLLAWLAREQPDVLCLQELKTTDEGFAHDAVRAAGYHAAVEGQKTYNGVAILSRAPLEDVRHGLGDGVDDPQARLVAARVAGVRVLSVYVPNGQSVASEKYRYKLAWLERLRAHLAANYDPREPLALCGDLNVATDDRDVAHPAQWR